VSESVYIGCSMLTAPKHLKLQTSNSASIFQGPAPTRPLKDFQKMGVIRLT